MGRRPAARRRSTVRFRAIVNQAESDPVAGSTTSRGPQREERVLDHLFRDASIRCQPGRDGEDRGAVPVIEVRQGVVRPTRDRADEGDVVGATRTVLRRLRRPRPVGFIGVRETQRATLDAVERTMSVSLVKTLGTP